MPDLDLWFAIICVALGFVLIGFLIGLLVGAA